MAPGTARCLGLNVEAKRGEIQHVDEGIDRAVRQEGSLASIKPFDEPIRAGTKSCFAPHPAFSHRLSAEHSTRCPAC